MIIFIFQEMALARGEQPSPEFSEEVRERGMDSTMILTRNITPENLTKVDVVMCDLCVI